MNRRRQVPLDKLDMTLDELAWDAVGPIGGRGGDWTGGSARSGYKSRNSAPYPPEEDWHSWSYHYERPKQWIQEDKNLCYIGRDVDVNRVAGRVAHGLRSHSTYTVIPLDWDCVWTTLKVMALARSYITPDNLDFSFELVDNEYLDGRLPADFAYELSIDTDNWVEEAENGILPSDENYVSGSSEPGKMAGRIANIIREDRDLFLSLSGPPAGQQAVQSLQYAKTYIKEEGRDLHCALSFGKSEKMASIVHISIFKVFSACRVSNTTDIHGIAGYVARGIREGRPPCVRAIGATNLNTAVKAVALARTFLNEDKERIDVACRVDFPEYCYNPETLKMKMNLTRIAGEGVRNMSNSKATLPLYVSGNTQKEKVAGALANRVRNRRQVFLAAMGPQPVSVSLKCILLANRFLIEDSMRIRMAPEFADSEKGASCLCLHILPELWV